MELKKRRGLVVPESAYGVCLWKCDDGAVLSDGDGYLSLEGRIGDMAVEEKMRKAAKYWLQTDEGKPYWVSGARKITQDEWDEQNQRLQDGLIPDPVEEARLSMKRGKNEAN